MKRPPEGGQKRGDTMKRDLDLLRQMLLRIESLDSSKHKITVDSFSDLNSDWNAIVLHIELLMDAGFIEAIDVSTCSADDYVIRRITFAGYDYLDSIRNDSIWAEVKQKIASVGGSVSLEIVKELGVTLVRQHLV